LLRLIIHRLKSGAGVVAIVVAIAISIAMAGLLSADTAIADRSQAGKPVRDLYYGEVLFHFYQKNDFEALTHLLAAREAGRVSNHEADAELLTGGLYLAYGQHEQAGEIFSRLLNESTDPIVRDRAWLYVGKARYERGRFEAADEAFARIGDALPKSLAAEFDMLRAQNWMAQGNFSAAAELLDDWRGTESWGAYANYNLGVALVRMDRISEGAERLDRVGRISSDEPELIALRDKANLALGYAYLQTQQPVAARSVLERVRIDGPFSNKALLGVGWADVMREDYRSALNPWLELQERDLLDSAVQESLLAVPYAFSQLGAAGSAADHYVTAMNHFDGELDSLNSAIARARSGELLPALLVGDDAQIGRLHWNLESLPTTSDSRYLYHLIANHEFQDGLRSYRDLVALDTHLEGWRHKLATFEHMLETRRLAYAARLPAVESRFANTDLAALGARREALATRIVRIEAERDVVGLASGEEARQWSDISALEANAAFTTDAAAAARDKHRVIKGSLLWQLDAEFGYRLWQQKRNLTQLDEHLALARSHESSVLQARDQAPLGMDGYAARIALLKPRLEAMQTQIAAVLDQQQSHLTLVATTELELQQARLLSYRVQARFALATIYDRATVAQRDSGDLR
jgi:tetratricopeptide (TPR) repeat protein